ncbi:ribosomal protein S18-alanine N-acetyltransferase [Methanogenium organophilum]|uniref:Ribosomal protein S18-alanine N-acetyltransferase n=1 Tax=Methanogenium organophilum TaxID=2199 RepID=A0A9X9T6W2_METOG|nr:ribosomal protein S18-alanine N-acetyltransferase [Methanogenium organophilum]WAI00414.1 ribosomal protein S18-alanine N-acetyltransferase [Methanogenium organophilum]
MQNTDIHIRRARQADLQDICAIEHELFPDPWDESAFQDALYLFPGLFFVAERGNEVIGFVCAGMEDTGDAVYGHIMNIAIKPSSQRQGAGGKLLQRIEFECMILGAEAMQLEVRVSNHDAQRFYQRYGYAQVFMVDSYYSNGEDGVLMMRWFT